MIKEENRERELIRQIVQGNSQQMKPTATSKFERIQGWTEVEVSRKGAKIFFVLCGLCVRPLEAGYINIVSNCYRPE
jgi:hypothetical protein